MLELKNVPSEFKIVPSDSHNMELVSNVHPSDWINPEPASRYNMAVIGAGTAGLVTAAACAGLGAKVALIERHLIGGDCLNYGCVPSKALIRASRAYADVRDAGKYGVIVPEGAKVDFPSVMKRLRHLRAEISKHDSARRFKELGVDVFIGEGIFNDRDAISVNGKILRFSKACIATGARATVPPIPGIKEAGFLTNETLFNITELPKRLAVIGAGPIGCEMSQAFRRFGSEVFLIEMSPQILIREDKEAAECIQKSMLRDGVNLVLNAKIISAGLKNGQKVIMLERNGKAESVVVDEILIGVGRAPNVEGLNLEAAGIEYDKTGVKVNDRLQTTNPRVYAAGDISSIYKFTHMADALARIVVQNALFMGRAKASVLTIPWCTYTDPEIAHVGMYEKDADKNGIPVETFVRELKEVDRAVLDGEEDGFVKVHVRKGTDMVLGATIVARHAGEMISEITLLMVGGMGMKTISKVIHPYPTQAEAIRQVGDAYNRTRLTPFVKGLLSWWLSICR